MGIFFAEILLRASDSCGHPTGTTALAIDFRIRGHCLAEEKDLNLMPGFRKRVAVKKWKCRFCRVVRPPGTLNHYF
jgi:hypothetical protein